MRIAIDVMGGDHAPDAILDGALAALELLAPDDQIVLVGDGAIIRDMVREQGLASDPRLVIEPTTQVIGMAEPPTSALRNKPDSSIAKWAWLGSPKAEADRCEVIISAGNTGACVAAAQMRMRRLPGVHRPGIAVTIPTFYGPLVLCDVGANIVPKPMHLYQYGHMAAIYARKVHGIENPRVAVLSVGGEEGKGTDLTKNTHKLMRADPSLNYIGYVEGRELFDGKCDVIVTEGFTGNVVLKLAEGLAAGLFKTIAHEIFEHDPDLAMRFEPVVKSIYKKHDYHEYGGAPLLGANGTCIISHGSSEARTIKAAVAASIKFVNLGVNDAIVEVLGKHAGSDEEAA
ncbi:MAG: phosphate acyltransferase PlsX [Planctomycetes bacterium]|nr:phosphate acyltransferase PlsX [Planctomycetota bacterium]